MTGSTRPPLVASEWDFDAVPPAQAPACFFYEYARQFALGGELGARFVIETANTLTNWTPLATVTNFLGTVQFTDGMATNLPGRFYRAIRE